MRLFWAVSLGQQDLKLLGDRARIHLAEGILPGVQQGQQVGQASMNLHPYADKCEEAAGSADVPSSAPPKDLQSDEHRTTAERFV